MYGIEFELNWFAVLTSNLLFHSMHSSELVRKNLKYLMMSCIQFYLLFREDNLNMNTLLPA